MPKLERVLRVEAVVLRHTDWGEADRFLSLFTREKGKLRAVAKGIRRLHSRKAGHLEPFTRVALLLAAGREMWIVTQAEAREIYQPIRDDLMRTGQAAYVIELLDKFTYEEGANPRLYDLLVDTLSLLSQETDLFYPLRVYELRLLDLLGFRPELYTCVRCQSEIQPQDQFFSAQLGGALCPSCGPLAQEARAVSMPALKYLRHFQRSNYVESCRASISDSVRHEMENLMHYNLTYLLERGLNSTGFIREISRPYPGE